VYSFISYLLQPYVLLLFLTVTAALFLWRSRGEPRRRFRWLIVPLVALIVLSMPAVSYLVVGSLEWRHKPLEQRPKDTPAIVVLGGGVQAPDAGRPQAELDSTSLYRCLHAVQLYRQGPPCLVLVSGGKPDAASPGPACADLMAVLLVELGVRPTDVIVENVSRTTYENAVLSRRILQERHIDEVVLVTEATHLPRAVLCFHKEGIAVVPSGCHYQATAFKGSLYDFLPSPVALGGCETASHEWIGLAWYWLSGKI